MKLLKETVMRVPTFVMTYLGDVRIFHLCGVVSREEEENAIKALLQATACGFV